MKLRVSFAAMRFVRSALALLLILWNRHFGLQWAGTQTSVHAAKYRFIYGIFIWTKSFRNQNSMNRFFSAQCKIRSNLLLSMLPFLSHQQFNMFMHQMRYGSIDLHIHYLHPKAFSILLCWTFLISTIQIYNTKISDNKPNYANWRAQLPINWILIPALLKRRDVFATDNYHRLGTKITAFRFADFDTVLSFRCALRESFKSKTLKFSSITGDFLAVSFMCAVYQFWIEPQSSIKLFISIQTIFSLSWLQFASSIMRTSYKVTMPRY